MGRGGGEGKVMTIKRGNNDQRKLNLNNNIYLVVLSEEWNCFVYNYFVLYNYYLHITKITRHNYVMPVIYTLAVLYSVFLSLFSKYRL